MTTQSRIGRRGFFMTLAGIAGLGGLLARGKGGAPGQHRDQKETVGEKPGGGYRETEHIRKYYSKARI